MLTGTGDCGSRPSDMRFGGDMDMAIHGLERYRPVSLFNALAPWVLLIAPGALATAFGAAAPVLFAPAGKEPVFGMLGVMVSTIALAGATATTVAIARRGARWPVVLAVGLVSLVAANVVALWLGFQTLEPQVSFPGIHVLDEWLPTTLWYLFAGTEVFGWGGAALAVAGGAAAGYQLSKWGGRPAE